MVGADGVELVIRSEREMLTLVATAAILEPVIGITTRHSLSMDPHLRPHVPKWGDTIEVVSRPVTATLMDGKALAATVRGEVARDVAALGVPVGLATVLVGDDPASAIYVRMKREACAGGRASSRSTTSSPRTRPRRDLLALVAELNADARVTGILTQLPAAGADRRGPRHQRDRPDEGRRRLPSGERRLPAPGTPDARRRRRRSGVMEILRRLRGPAGGCARRRRRAARTSSGSRGAPAPAENATVTICAQRARATSARSYARGRRRSSPRSGRAGVDHGRDGQGRARRRSTSGSTASTAGSWATSPRASAEVARAS